MSRRKPVVVAWGVVFPNTVEAFSTRDEALGRAADCSIMAMRVAKLVEADPAADAVVRAARAFAKQDQTCTSRAIAELRLCKAVDRLLKKRGKR